MDRKLWPTGIRPHGNGIQIRIWRKQLGEYTETLPGNIHKQTDLTRAIKRRDQLLARVQLGLPLLEDEVTDRQLFVTVAQDYLDTLEAKLRTQSDYLNILNTFWLPAFKGFPIDEVTSPKIKRELTAMKVSSKTKRNRLNPLIGVLDHAGITPNPAKGIKLKRHQKASLPRYTPTERSNLIKTLQGQAKAYFAILFGCGLRPGEALGLTWSDYDGQHLDISKQMTARRLEPTTKTYITRKVYVPEWAQQILNNHDTRFQGEHIFINTQGNHHRDTDLLNNAWRQAHKRARIPYRIPYACRHTRASELLSIGIEPGDAAKQLGHSMSTFLKVYAEWIEEFAKHTDNSRFEGVGIDVNTKNNK